MTSYKLYKLTEMNGSGSPEDESETWTTTISYHLISEKEEDNFGEWLAEKMSYQDYSYQVKCHEIMKFENEDELCDIYECLGEKCR